MQLKQSLARGSCALVASKPTSFLSNSTYHLHSLTSKRPLRSPTVQPKRLSASASYKSANWAYIARRSAADAVSARAHGVCLRDESVVGEVLAGDDGDLRALAPGDRLRVALAQPVRTRGIVGRNDLRRKHAAHADHALR
eukprot:5176999-Pleurochrysis_carterae.AAC.2